MKIIKSKINFPTTTNKECDQKITELLSQASQYFYQEFYELGLLAICIGGSVGRGEGMAIIENNHVKIISDFDFTLIANTRSDAQIIRERLPLVLKELNQKMSGKGLQSYVDCGVTDRAALSSASPTLFWFEFVNTGKIIYSADNHFVLPVIPIKAVFQIEPITLICNRIVEQFKIFSINSEEDFSAPNDYRNKIATCARTYGDIGKALLLYEGMYHFTCDERNKELSNIKNSNALPDKLANRIIFWSRFKNGINIETALKKYKVETSVECLEIIKNELAADLIAIWKLLSKHFSTFKNGGSIRQLALNFRVSDSLKNVKNWMSFLIKSNKMNNGARLIQLSTALKFFWKMPPIWIAYLPAVLLYNYHFVEKKYQDDMVIKEMKYYLGSIASNKTEQSLELYKMKALAIWDYIAMGGRHIQESEQEKDHN